MRWLRSWLPEGEGYNELVGLTQLQLRTHKLQLFCTVVAFEVLVQPEVADAVSDTDGSLQQSRAEIVCLDVALCSLPLSMTCWLPSVCHPPGSPLSTRRPRAVCLATTRFFVCFTEE